MRSRQPYSRVVFVALTLLFVAACNVATKSDGGPAEKSDGGQTEDDRAGGPPADAGVKPDGGTAEDDAGCTPKCAEATCGNDDECGGRCFGTCADSSKWRCDELQHYCRAANDRCLSRACGENGTDGRQCDGPCPTGERCIAKDEIWYSCRLPDCDGKSCGDDDGAGSLCSVPCPDPEKDCVPEDGICRHRDCGTSLCGDDGHGGICGVCTGCDGETLPTSECYGGRCPMFCCPDCEGRSCGDADGCGGVCLGPCSTPGDVCDLDALGCRPPEAGAAFDCGDTEAVPAADFEIYSLAINHRFAGNAGNKAYFRSMTQPDDLLKCNPANVAGAAQETVAAYLEANFLTDDCYSESCRRSFCLPGPFRVVLDEQIVKAAEFDASLAGPHDKDPFDVGYLWLSRLGFNAARDEALVYVALSCGKLCGEGHMILLRADAGVWEVANARVCWQA